MESFSRSSGDEEEFGRAQVSSQRVNVDGNVTEQKPGTPTTPRSKHSATEQRRRCKINDRFQILRDLIPHSDQKRDKASLLLEVIEYVKFLQEKVQKYESYPGGSQEHEKLVPWSNNRAPADGTSDPHFTKNGPVHAAFFSAGKIVDNTIPMSSTSLTDIQNVADAEMNTGTAAMLVPMQSNYYPSVGSRSCVTQLPERLFSDSDNLVSQSQSEWQRSSNAADCSASSDMMNEQEELAVDDGTISVSSVYSEGLLSALEQAVANSGLDMSQATISIQINLGRHSNRRLTTAHPAACRKEHNGHPTVNQEMVDSRAAGNGEEPNPPASSFEETTRTDNR